jgi:hypothetical protein
VSKRDQSDTSIFAFCETVAPKPDQFLSKQHQIVLGPSYFSQQRHLFLKTESLNCLRESIGDDATTLVLYQTRLSIITGPWNQRWPVAPALSRQGDWGLADDDGQAGGRAE